MNQFLLKAIFFSIITLGFVSCSSDDDEPWIEPEVTTTGVYILNSGKMGDDNANLGYYDLSKNVDTKNIFTNQNSQPLGDSGQDMVIYGSKMYISVTGSNKIYITDLKAKLLKYSNGASAIIDPKNDKNEPEGPRFLAADGGKVYVSLKTGYVARIDTATLTIDKKVKVGSYPEQIIATNNKLYVANSGYGYDNTVSVIDLNSFTETKKIDVVVNPNFLVKDNNNNIYVLSWGRTWGGANIKSSLQKLNATSEEVTALGTDIATKMAMNRSKDKIYIINEVYDSNWNLTINLSYYDLKTNKHVKTSFVTATGNIDLSKAYSISVDPVNGNIYIGTSDFSNTGDMYIFSENGTFISKFDTGGLNPMGAYFVNGTSK